MRAQLRRATERHGSMNSKKMLFHLSQPMEKETQVEIEKRVNDLPLERRGGIDNKVTVKLESLLRSDSMRSHTVDETSNKKEILRKSCSTPELFLTNDNDGDGQESPDNKRPGETKKRDVIVIPDDYLCPISLELMRDPVIVATGQVWLFRNDIW